MAMMSATYATIGRELWGHKAIGEATAVQRESIKSKRRVSDRKYCCSGKLLITNYGKLEISAYFRYVGNISKL